MQGRFGFTLKATKIIRYFKDGVNLLMFAF